jgi:hypothetical protein
MPETITKELCKHYGEFTGNCEFCLDAYDCEQIAFRSRESKRTPENDWVKG